MLAYGFDLAGPSHLEATAGVVLEVGDTLRYRDHAIGLSDSDIRARVGQGASAEGAVAGLDAPLSYQPGGGDREADRRLREALTEAGGSGSSVMPPTMTKMAYLTLRGMTVARMLDAIENLDMAETHPASTLIFHGAEASTVGQLKQERAARGSLLETMARVGVRELPSDLADEDHLVAACAAALAVARWHLDASEWYHPPDPPHHPYPVVC